VLLLRIKQFMGFYSVSLGNAGGMFLKRSRVKKPGQEVFKSEFSEYIKAEELYIGATVNINGYLFILLNADEYTLNYMENNTDKVRLCVILASLPFAVFVFLSLEHLLYLATGLHCIFTYVGMNNGSVRLGHRSHHIGPVFVCSVYLLSSPLPSITDSRHQWEAGPGLNQVFWIFC
jgi:hypothetical protein